LKDFHLINWTMEVAKDLTASQTTRAFSTDGNVQDNAKSGGVQVSGVAAELIGKQPEMYASGRAAGSSTGTVTAVTNSSSLQEITVPHIRTRSADPDRAMGLRWVLRDIAANRLKLSPVSELDLQDLIEMKLVELRDGIPHLTSAGVTAII
jgi:hypothetical protein